MIYYLCTRQHAYTLRSYLVWDQPRARSFHFLFYQDLPRLRWLLPGTYIFTDMERLSPPQLRLAQALYDQLAPHLRPEQLLNRPDRMLSRSQLIRRLRDAGMNRYNACRLHEIDQVRFPCFVRRENDHDGPIGELLHDRAQLDAAVAEARAKGVPDHDLLIIEFCDTRDDAGRYRKYSAARIGPRIVPRHVFFGDHWMLKYPGPRGSTPETLAVEMDYLHTNPHAEQLMEIFQIAGVEHGRIDYALAGDQIQVWEINTNPTYAQPTVNPQRTPAVQFSCKMISEAFAAIDTAATNGATLPIRLDPRVTREVGYLPHHRLIDSACHRLRPIWHSPPLRPLRRLCEQITTFETLHAGPANRPPDRPRAATPSRTEQE